MHAGFDLQWRTLFFCMQSHAGLHAQGSVSIYSSSPSHAGLHAQGSVGIYSSSPTELSFFLFSTALIFLSGSSLLLLRLSLLLLRLFTSPPPALRFGIDHHIFNTPLIRFF
ncbi:hypothetical protein MANES_02G049450v8 [Manihot esculenta]|uniref:Alpha-1,4 glucan phosphorylase n=1 Tax=Manihot esculenta TaxID=3983 RepID=A0A2C9WDN8_MANES|nr:hypothetical protein MANES_02G049450v8 [Manihot esculenta]